MSILPPSVVLFLISRNNKWLKHMHVTAVKRWILIMRGREQAIIQTSSILPYIKVQKYTQDVELRAFIRRDYEYVLLPVYQESRQYKFSVVVQQHYVSRKDPTHDIYLDVNHYKEIYAMHEWGKHQTIWWHFWRNWWERLKWTLLGMHFNWILSKLCTFQFIITIIIGHKHYHTLTTGNIKLNINNTNLEHGIRFEMFN